MPLLNNRPRASDFDAPQTVGRRPSPSLSDHHHRRASPSYESPPVHHPHQPLQHQRHQRLTPEKSLDPYHHQFQNINNAYSKGYPQGGRDDFFDKRRIEREKSRIDFWPKSPDRPYGEEKNRHRSNHQQHSQRSKKKESRHSKSERRTKKHHKSDDSESDPSQRRHHHQSRKKHRSLKQDKTQENDKEDEEESSHDDDVDKKKYQKSKPMDKLNSSPVQGDEWIEKQVITTLEITPHLEKDSLLAPSRPTKVEEFKLLDDEEVGEVGPMPYNHVTGKAMDPKEFGRALRPGEGSAMAAFIEAGERIPRRGEIGLTGTEIEKFENVGYVMSGSRHRRMNAVRIRKENQVISAEEKRGILKMQAEEKAKREGQIISSFRELVDTKLQETG